MWILLRLGWVFEIYLCRNWIWNHRWWKSLRGRYVGGKGTPALVGEPVQISENFPLCFSGEDIPEFRGKNRMILFTEAVVPSLYYGTSVTEPCLKKRSHLEENILSSLFPIWDKNMCGSSNLLCKEPETHYLAVRDG